MSAPAWPRPPRLKTGEVVFDPDRPEQRYRVGRVTVGSASLHPIYQTAREVTLRRKDGTETTFTASESGTSLQVSPYSLLKRVTDPEGGLT